MTKKLRRLFPRLFGDQYRLMSGRTKKYNCIAWAAGCSDAWWEPSPDGYWPPDVPADGTVETAIRLFERLGYSRTEDASFEAGVSKVAVYGDEDGYTHAARQLPNGKWTSKLGKLQDIEHDTLESLTGNQYGSVRQVLKKPVSAPAAPSQPEPPSAGQPPAS